MKLFTKLFLPTMTITSLGLATSCSCKINVDPQPITKDYLLIEGTTLMGFKPEYRLKANFPESSYKLVIPKEVTKIANQAFCGIDGIQDAQELITSIEYEQNCQCTSFGIASFGGCTNLTKVVLPPLYNCGDDASLFANATKLATIDISNLEATFTLQEDYLSVDETWEVTDGVVLYDSSKSWQADIGNALLEQINAEGYTWILKPI